MATSPNAPVTAKQRHAAERIGGLLAIGLLLLLMGAVTAGFAMAHKANAETAASECDGYLCDDEGPGAGADIAFIGGLLVAGTGQVLVLIGAVGHGVALGIARAGEQHTA